MSVIPKYKITVIHDQLNTHVPASLYKAFEPTEAKRILDKLEFHYTPKHGSWLNMAEIEREGRWGFPSLSNHAVELSVLARQCLARRIPDQKTLKQEVTAWEARRNLGISLLSRPRQLLQVGEPAQRTASQYSPYRDLRHLKALAWMINALLCSGTINLREWEAYMLSRARKAQSTER